MYSGPLSQRIAAGFPRHSIICSRLRITRRWVMIDRKRQGATKSAGIFQGASEPILLAATSGSLLSSQQR